MARPADVEHLNPEFHNRINRFLTAAAAAGIPSDILSGYRDNALQAKLRANFEAKQAGKPLPYPEEGEGGLAARPGESYHNYGFATDVIARNGQQDKLIAFAAAHPEFGVVTIGSSDRDHFQMAGNLATLRSQYGDGLAGGGSAGGSSTAVSGVDNRQIFFDALTKQAGLTPQQALGVLWSMGGESHQNLDTSALNPNDPGGAFGAAQWEGTRRWPLEEIAKHQGVAATDPHLQAQYLVGELTGNMQGATLQPGVLAALKAAKTPEEAAHVWTAQFERPKEDNSDVRIKNGQMVSSIDANGNLVLKPVSGASGGAVAGAGTGSGVGSATGAPGAAEAPPNPWATLGQALSSFALSPGVSSGGGLGVVDPPDQPAIRSPALDANFELPVQPVPAQYAQGVGSTLGSLAIQPQDTSLDIDSITSGAPSMTAMIGPVGGVTSRYGDPRAAPSPGAATRYPGLG